MYLEHFGLRERPFSHVPDARFIYLGERHERALAHLRQSVQVGSGVTYLIGASGIGKTTICRQLLNQLPEHVRVALISDPVPTPQALLSVVCDQLGVAYGMDARSLILNDLFRRQGAGRGARRTALIVDDAQSLSLDVLEQLYLLSSLEIDGQKLLEIVLIGEPWLVDLLPRVATHQPWKSAGYHLLPFSETETFAYVRHRMATAGGGRDIFDVDALRDVHRLSSGVPRAINTICARALLTAVARQRRSIDRPTVRAAARSAPGFDAPARLDPIAISREPARSPVARSRRPRWPWLVTGGLVLNALAIGAALLPPRARHVTRPSDARVEAEALPRRDPSPSRTNPILDERPREFRQPETAEPIPPPVLTARPLVPPPARGAAPVTSIAREPSAPAEETSRQRRRRERAELRAATASNAPISATTSDSVPPQQLPLKIDMLVWAAEPGQRMVYVNGHKYVEGQTLENGAVLEHIEPDGIVLIQEGRRVRLRSEAR
ncbi:MAG: hypothetical protein DMD87_25565 [Candidatus Rokuibacteriota bacterium]|nr:MAG: hypothetical protein DMD87_25565 [Candidatus Rokubacteria bacterium]